MQRGFLKGLFIFCILMLLLLAVSYPFAQPGSATYVVIQLSVIHIVAAMLIIGALLHFDWDPFRAFR